MLIVFGLCAALLSLVSYIPYIFDIFRKGVRPERSTWFIWALLGAVIFFSQLAAGARASLWMSGVQVVGDIFIFILALKYGEGGFRKRNVIALVAAGFGVALWHATGDPLIALSLAILVDFAGAWLTLVKVYEKPKSEPNDMWILAGISGLLAALAVGKMDYGLLAYPLYVVAVNAVILVAKRLGMGKIGI